MTDTYDKENCWYGWNGGECPVHPETEVSAMQHSGIELCQAAKHFDWRSNSIIPIIAFRITRLYHEPKKPREWWLNKYDVVMDGPFVSTEDADDAAWEGRTERIHVREVLPEGDA
jgi:hypothetical protein